MSSESNDRGPLQQPGMSGTTRDETGTYSQGAGSGIPQRSVPEGLVDAGTSNKDQTGQAKAAAARAVESEKSALARQLSGLAEAMDKVGAELRQSDQLALGRYTQQVGNSIGRLARDCESRDIAEIARMAEDFGRRQPLAFLGLAAIAGLAASRLMTASAQRSDNRAGAAEARSSPERSEERSWHFEKDVGNA